MDALRIATRSAVNFPSLKEFAQHAHRFGADMVYETAQGMGATPQFLANLAVQLRGIPRDLRFPKADLWELTAEQRTALFAALKDEWDDKRLARYLGTTARTIGRWRAEQADPENG